MALDVTAIFLKATPGHMLCCWGRPQQTWPPLKGLGAHDRSVTGVNRIGIAAAVAVILVVGFPSLTVPQTSAQTSPLVGEVSGFVHSDLGAPLANAIVVATSNASGSEAQTVYTDEAGHYGLKLTAGTWRLNVTARAHDGKAEQVVALAGGVPVEKNFTLVHNGPAIKGKVLDAKTGAPVAEAWVEAYPNSGYRCNPNEPCPLAADAPASGAVMPESYRMPYTTRTKADGTYGVAIDRNDAGSVNLRAWKENYRDSYQTIEVTGDTTADLRLEPIPPRSAVLEGRVVDAKTGAPIADAWVNAWPTYDEVQAMERETRIAQEGSASGGGTAGSAGSTEPAAPPAVAPSVAPSPAIYPCCQFEGNSTQTDRDGRFRMAMHPGTYQFSVGAAEHGHHQERVTLADGETKAMAVRLEPIPPDSVTIRGTVLDKATGRPVAGAWVSVENQQWGAYNGAQADAQGKFELKTKPGWTMVWVRVDGNGYAMPAQADAPVASDDTAASKEPATGIRAPDERPYIQPEGSYYPWVRGASYAEDQAVDLRVELQPKPKADLKLQGYVLDAKTKAPIPNAYVNVHNEDTGDWGWGQTDQYGSFVFQARPGTHTLHANAEGHFGNAVVVAVSGATTRVDVALEPGSPQGSCCIAYATKGGAGMEDGRASGTMTPSPSPAMAPAPGSPGADQSAGQGEASASSRNSQLSGSGSATYAATGESLGPYDPSRAPAPGTPQPGGAAVPGPAALLVLAGLGAAAVLVRRRK